MDVSKDLVKMLVKDLATAMDMRKTVEDLAFNDLIDKTEKAEQLMMSLNTMKLVLEEEGPQKRLIMEVVTAEEGNLLWMAMGKRRADRLALPFQMMKTFYLLGAEVEGAVLYSCENFEMKAKLYVQKADGHEFALDLRLVDALILTLLADVPLYAKEGLLSAQQQPLESTEKYGADRKLELLHIMPVEDLQREMDIAIRHEKYEYAEAVRKIMEQKKENRKNNL